MNDPAHDTEGESEGHESTRPDQFRHMLRVDIYITALLFVLLTAVTFGGVIFRYALNSPISWIVEVQLALFLSVVYLGGGSAFRHGSHVYIDALTCRFPPRARRIVALGIHVITTGILGYFAWQGTGMAIEMFNYSRTTNILGIPSYLIYATIPTGMIWMIVNYVYAVAYGEEQEISIGT